MLKRLAAVAGIIFAFTGIAISQQKTKITLDEFFNAVYYRDVRLAPDGNAVVFATERADWSNERFRNDLWLYRVSSKSLVPLTQSGHDSSPQWSPDGRWIAFLSDRGDDNAAGKDDSDKDKPKDVAHVYVISATGGEAFAVTRGEEESLNVALVVGGSIVIPHLRRAYALLEELYS